MEAVCDTSAIIKLARGGAVSCLGGLFEVVYIPQAVFEECSKPATRRAVEQPVFRVCSVNQGPVTGLGRGEREAINLALERGLDTFITEDDKAFRRSLREGLKPVRVFDLLVIAKARQLIPSVKAILGRMQTNGEGIREDLYRATLKKAGEL